MDPFFHFWVLGRSLNLRGRSSPCSCPASACIQGLAQNVDVNGNTQNDKMDILMMKT